LFWVVTFAFSLLFSANPRFVSKRNGGERKEEALHFLFLKKNAVPEGKQQLLLQSLKKSQLTQKEPLDIKKRYKMG